MRTKQITLNDIAKKLNVSTVTVSKALRGHPDISPATTKLVHNMAKEIGYSPNFIARNLSSRKSNMIGVVVPKIAHHFFSSIIEQIYDFAFRNSYEIILTVSQEDADREYKHIQTLLSMRVDGILISISQQTNELGIFDIIKERGVPLVFVDRIPDLQDVNTVTCDDYLGAYKAIKHAVGLGYRKIAFLAGKTYINIGRDRLRGFRDAMRDSGIEINPSWILEGEFSEKSGYDSFMKLHHENNLPDMLFAVTYPVALGVYLAAQELGVKIPDDVDLICFGNSQMQNFLTPPLSCVNQPTDQLANRSMEILFDNIDHKEEFVTKQIVVDTDLILRGTCVKFNRG